MCEASLGTYDATIGLVRGRCLGIASASETESSEKDILPLLDAPSSGSAEAALYFPLREGLSSSSSPSSSSSSSSWEEGALVPPDVAPKVPLWWRPSPASLTFFLTSILNNRGSAESLGSGAGHLICFAFFIQP